MDSEAIPLTRRGPKRPTWTQALLLKHGIPPWLVAAVLVAVLLFAAVVYFFGRGPGVKIPAPAGIDLPTDPTP